jgi:hypothetical protein
MKIRNYLRQEWNMYLRNVLLRDKCEFCGSTENLHVHHEDRFHDLFTETLRELELMELEVEEYYENELNLLSNVMLGKQLKIEYKTLCRDCHMKLHMAKKRNGEYAQTIPSEYGTYFFIELKELKKINIENNMLTRFIRLCSLMDFSNRVRYGVAKGKRVFATTKDIQEMLLLKKTEVARTKKYLIENELIFVNEDKTITINKKFASKGYTNDIERNIVFAEEFNRLYETIDARKHSPIGNVLIENSKREQSFEYSTEYGLGFKHRYRGLEEINSKSRIFKTKKRMVMINPQLFFFEGYQDIREMIKRYGEF